MSPENLSPLMEAPATRRDVVKTGAKLAYVAPALVLLVPGASSGGTPCVDTTGNDETTSCSD